jgi:hypothetical protein
MHLSGFLSMCCIMSIISVMVPYLWSVFNMRSEYSELLLLFLIAWTCSLYLVRKALPVCPTYLIGQYKHFVWQMPLSCNLSVRECSFTILYCVLHSQFCFP